MSRIADLLVERGNALANGQAQSGAIWGQAVQGLGQTFGQLAADYPKMKAEQQARDQAKQQDTALRQLFSGPEPPTPDAIIRIVGPERGVKIAEGLSALNDIKSKRVTDARTTAGRLALGMKSLSPEMRAELSPSIREAVIAGGLGTADQVPEQLDDNYLDAVIAWGTGSEAKKPEAPKPQPLMDRGKLGVFDPNVGAYVPGTAAPADPAKPWTPGAGGVSPEERLALSLGYKDETGRPLTERLTEAQANAARNRAARATHITDPKEPKAQEQEWVIRSGQPMPIAKGSAQPGDRPYNAASEQAVSAKAAEKAQTDDTKRNRAQSVIDLVDSLVTIKGENVTTKHPGFDAVYGPTEGRLPTFKKETADAEAIVDRVISLVTQPEMQTLRGLGPASDRDVAIIQAGATTLQNKRMSEPAARKELKRVREAAARLLTVIGTSAPSSGGDDPLGILGR